MVEQQDRGVSERCDSVEVEEKESFLVVEADTVVDPWAVMVDQYDTLRALIAMVDVWWLD